MRVAATCWSRVRVALTRKGSRAQGLFDWDQVLFDWDDRVMFDWDLAEM